MLRIYKFSVWQWITSARQSNVTRLINHQIPLRVQSSVNSVNLQTLSVGMEVQVLENVSGDWTNIHVGTRTGWVRATLLRTTGPSSIIRVGSRVRVNQSARNRAMGTKIAPHVHGQTYIVLQIRNNNNELLLQGVNS